MASSFSLPTNEQSSSGLYSKLSEDIRHQIFRYLLLPSSAAEADGLFVEQDNLDNHAHLSSQLLRCCQKLYKECEPVLYDCNKLQIVLQDDCLTVSDGHIDMENRFHEHSRLYPIRCSNTNNSLQHLASGTLHEEQSRGAIGEYSFTNSWVSSNINAILKIRHIVIYVACYSPNQMYDYARVLQSVVTGKRVVLEFDLDRNTDDNDIDSLLQALHLWRCNSITIKGLPASMSVASKIMITLITFQTTVTDLWSKLRILLNECEGDAKLTAARYLLTNNAGDQEFWKVHKAVTQHLTDGSGDGSDDSSGGDDSAISDDDENLMDRMLIARQSRGEADRNRPATILQRTYMANIWRMIRRGDTVGFMAWRDEFEEYIRGTKTHA